MMGSCDCPIVMTSISDDVDNPSDIALPPSTAGRGLWGGLIILGNADFADTAATNDIEGLPSGDPRNLYGGSDDNDNSGVYTYVSVRHGGSIIGAANEINGITFGAVGRNTVVNHIEVFQNVDDAVEFFGGTVNVKNAILAFGGDDQVDYDEGWRGCMQFVFAIADTLDSDTYGEHDGAVVGVSGAGTEDATPFATPLLSNVTAIGARPGAANINNQFFNIRDNAGAGYFNSIFTEGNNRAIDIEDAAFAEDSRRRLSVGDIKFSNNYFWNFTALSAQAWTLDSIFGPTRGNRFIDPKLGCLNYGAKDSLDPRPDPWSPAVGTWIDPATNYAPPANPGLTWGGFFTPVTYTGAFDPNVSLDDSWAANWSFLHCGGYLGDCRKAEVTCNSCLTTDNGKPVKVITSADIVGTYTFVKDTVYNLSGFVYVESGESIFIQEGTVFKSNPGQAAAATALIIARGGQINAFGTQCEPIVFTSISDDVDLLNDVPLPPSTAGRGLWGGLILLGNARFADTAATNDIEGLPSGDPRNLYGGVNDDDNSGVLKYVSVRHGGSIIGAANEINGITFGAVGRNTMVDYIEVFQNVDDAVEFFGGTVNVKHASLAFGGDDQVDYDEGWRGCMQFVFTIADSLDSDTYAEHDGAVVGVSGAGTEDATPFATPLLSNVTAIGARPSAANINNQFFNIRDNAGAGYFNSIFTEGNNRAIDIEDAAFAEDARKRLSVGDIKFMNNLFGVFTSFTAQSWTRDSIFNIPALANDTTGLVMGTINYGTKDSLDPRPDATVRVMTWVDPASNYNPPANPGLTWAGFFDTVNYLGAFDPNQSIEDSWVSKWTFLWCADYLGDSRLSTSCCVGIRGNVDCDGAQSIDIGDLTVLVDHLFISFTPLCCEQEGDMVIDSSVDIADLTFLVDHLFITFTPQPGC
jgi:hypothetical protein